MYADDIVILADDKKILQKMIDRLENYCSSWSMVVNLEKSKIMVFRKGGRLSNDEKWYFCGNEIEIVSSYCYLGVILTPRLSFQQHINERNSKAKKSINSIWKHFLGKSSIKFTSKYQLFLAVCRAIQCYAAEIWGFGYFDEVNILQRYFIKKYYVWRITLRIIVYI